MAARGKSYGLIGAFREPEPLVAAARELRQLGIADIDAFTPFPIDSLDDVLGIEARRLPWLTLAGGVFGALAAYGLVLYSVEIDYPINIGGRALNAWPAYAVLAFEGGILGAALVAFFGMLVINRLPTYYHPIFNAPGFTLARNDTFYLFVKRGEAPFQAAKIRRALVDSGAVKIDEVPP